MSMLSPNVRERVAQRANYACEYCQTAQKISGAQMNVDHIIPARRHWIEAGWHPPAVQEE